ncbi:putative HTH-type transcriptional regulator [Klebsiella spallanzanii]|nr:putative HTH-type transcriptional regulator [Klebsiella huaxiensis]VUS93544.1 putative HTH-type transcriptional regulator [Klebsiella huaxiensis]VUT06020.1 putative HTH-type transcriptional regulator [Klebsiella spallanzanii]VUT13709.1 putative HTH-type transcriptional regulator [Klebsiella huaxiensis]
MVNDVKIAPMDKYETRRQRLLYIRDNLCGGKAVDVARTIGREPSYVSRMLYPEGKKQKKRIADEMVELIESSFNLPRGWMDGITGSIDSVGERVENSPQIQYVIEVLDAQASAGPGCIVSSEVDETVSSITYDSVGALRLFGNRPAENIKVITVSGDSMSGTIETGDYIFIDVSKDYFEGDGIYVFSFKGAVLVKRLQFTADGLLVHSDNSKYADWTIGESHEQYLKIIGRVIYSHSVKRFV